jgi:hypothetical protein
MRRKTLIDFMVTKPAKPAKLSFWLGEARQPAASWRRHGCGADTRFSLQVLNVL